MFYGIYESASRIITIKDYGILEQGHATSIMSADKKPWHDSSGEGVPNDGIARDHEMEQSP